MNLSMVLTKKAQGVIAGLLVVVSAGAGYGVSHLAPKASKAGDVKVAAPTQAVQEVIVVTPTSSPSASPTVFISPTKALYKVVVPNRGAVK